MCALCSVLREEGLLGLWKGLGPNVGRNAIINAAELASYDQVRGKFPKGSQGKFPMGSKGTDYACSCECSDVHAQAIPRWW